MKVPAMKSRSRIGIHASSWRLPHGTDQESYPEHWWVGFGSSPNTLAGCFSLLEEGIIYSPRLLMAEAVSEPNILFPGKYSRHWS